MGCSGTQRPGETPSRGYGMTSWFSGKFREAILATDLKSVVSGPWKLKIAALGLAFLLWIIVRLSTQSENPVPIGIGDGDAKTYATKAEVRGNNITPRWFGE